MRCKFLDITDEYTSIPILILEFEEADGVFLKKIGWDSGLRVVLNFSRKRVSCISGKSFKEDYGETIEELSQTMDVNGTIISFKESLNYIKDIRQLPDQFNVCDYRKKRILVRNRMFIGREVYDIIDDYGLDYCQDYLRKYKYTKPYIGYSHIAIFDVKTKELLSDVGRSSEYDLNILSEYMWIPFPEANDDEIESVMSIHD
jgi:hypothetical protein